MSTFSEILALGKNPKALASVFGLGAASESENADASFIGPLAKTWDEMAYAMAVKMQDAGVPPDEIFRLTNTAKAPQLTEAQKAHPEQWYQEVADNVKLKENQRSGRSRYKELDAENGLRARGIYENEPVGQAYDQLSDVNVRGLTPEQQANGRIQASVRPFELDDAGQVTNPARMRLDTNMPQYGTKQNIVHENQHLIDKVEGRTNAGGNREMFDNSTVNEMSEKLSSFERERATLGSKIGDIRDQLYKLPPGLASQDQRKALSDELKNAEAMFSSKGQLLNQYTDLIKHFQPHTQYKHLLGESMARLAERRMKGHEVGAPMRERYPFEFQGKQDNGAFGLDVSPGRILHSAEDSPAFLKKADRGATESQRADEMNKLLKSSAETPRSNIRRGIGAIAAGANWALDATDIPSRGIHGIANTIGTLASGGSWEDAIGSGARVAERPLDQTAQRLGTYVADKTQNPYLAALTNAVTNVTGL